MNQFDFNWFPTWDEIKFEAVNLIQISLFSCNSTLFSLSIKNTQVDPNL